MHGFSFRAMAKKLGGSTTLVTHYYRSREELLDDFAVRLVKGWTEEIKALEADVEDPHARLMLLIEWLLPLDEEGMMEERCRINLLADQLIGDKHRRIFDAWERLVRGLLREHVRELVPEDRVEPTIMSLGVLVNGIALSAVEHPSRWGRSQQLAVVSEVVSGLGLEGQALDGAAAQRRKPPTPSRRRESAGHS